jgi:phosphate transport system permease protein
VTNSPAVADAQMPLIPGSPSGPGITRQRRRVWERVVVGLLFLCAAVSVLTTVGIIASLVRPTLDFFGEVSVKDFLTGSDWAPLFNRPRFGVLPIVVATLVTTACALVVCIPLGLGTAVYLSEYARPGLRKTLKPAIEILAGVPTVVYGYFALKFVSPIVQDLWPFGEQPGVFNALSAGLVMGFMILPTVASLSEDAMTSVPLSLRQGAYALGSSGYEVATRVTIPAALSGIVASFVLAVSRAVGETMIVLIAAGNNPNLAFNPGEAMQTMTSFIASAGSGDLPQGSTGYKTIFAVGSLLFVVTFTLNIVSTRFVRRFREAYE